MYKSVSAFAPIANPINCPWGQKAFKGYFGEDQQQKWKEHDATELVKQWKGPLEMLIDVVSVPPMSLQDTTNRARAPEITSTSKASSFPRTLFKQPRKLATTRTFNSACSPTTTIATTSWPLLPMTTLRGRRSTWVSSKLGSSSAASVCSLLQKRFGASREVIEQFFTLIDETWLDICRTIIPALFPYST